MNVARLELSKALFELSGWDTEHEAVYRMEKGKPIITNAFDDRVVGTVPLYDLGYLLRKLPSEISIEKKYNHEDGVMYYAEANTGFESADTPEDAAVKLAIDLFRQGVLKRDENDQRRNDTTRQ